MMKLNIKNILICVVSVVLFYTVWVNTLVWIVPENIVSEKKIEIVWLKGRGKTHSIKFIDSPLAVWHRNMDQDSLIYKKYKDLPEVTKKIFNQIGEIFIINLVDEKGTVLVTLPFSESLYQVTIQRLH